METMQRCRRELQGSRASISQFSLGDGIQQISLELLASMDSKHLSLPTKHHRVISRIATSRLVLFLCILLGTLGASPSSAESTQKLFFIQRNKNRNEVHYDAQLSKDGTLRKDEPVIAYWILHEKGGKREQLNLVERKKAYGFTISPEPGGNSFRMTLVPYKERPIRVFVKDGRARATIVIAGKLAYLKKLYIHATEGIVMPTVNYIDLFGEDVVTGEERRERIVPK